VLPTVANGSSGASSRAPQGKGGCLSKNGPLTNNLLANSIPPERLNACQHHLRLLSTDIHSIRAPDSSIPGKLKEKRKEKMCMPRASIFQPTPTPTATNTRNRQWDIRRNAFIPWQRCHICASHYELLPTIVSRFLVTRCSHVYI
jgi:hypothetical protein